MDRTVREQRNWKQGHGCALFSPSPWDSTSAYHMKTWTKGSLQPHLVVTSAFQRPCPGAEDTWYPWPFLASPQAHPGQACPLLLGCLNHLPPLENPGLSGRASLLQEEAPSAPLTLHTWHLQLSCTGLAVSAPRSCFAWGTLRAMMLWMPGAAVRPGTGWAPLHRALASSARPGPEGYVERYTDKGTASLPLEARGFWKEQTACISRQVGVSSFITSYAHLTCGGFPSAHFVGALTSSGG